MIRFLVFAAADSDSGYETPTVDATGPGIIFGLAVLAVISIVLSLWIARYAKSKGHSYGAFLALGLLLTPIVSLIAVLSIKDKRSREWFHTQEDPMERLQRLEEMRETRQISEEEYKREEIKILGPDLDD